MSLGRFTQDTSLRARHKGNFRGHSSPSQWNCLSKDAWLQTNGGPEKGESLLFPQQCNCPLSDQEFLGAGEKGYGGQAVMRPPPTLNTK